MTRKRYFLLASLAIAASSMAYGQSPAQGQLPQPDASIAATVRVAAVRFAVSHGLELPSGDLVVAHENVFKAAHPSAPKLSLETLQSQAAAMATAVGRGAKTGSAEQLLVCKFSSCAPGSTLDSNAAWTLIPRVRMQWRKHCRNSTQRILTRASASKETLVDNFNWGAIKEWTGFAYTGGAFTDLSFQPSQVVAWFEYLSNASILFHEGIHAYLWDNSNNTADYWSNACGIPLIIG